MRNPSIPGLLAPLAVLAALLLFPTVATAQGLNEIQPAGDTVTGRIESAGEVVRIPYTLVDGTLFSVQAKADKGSSVFLDLNLLGVDRRDDSSGNALIKASKKGNKVSIKNHPINETGLRYLEVRGANGTTGAWTIKFKVKVPTKLSAVAAAPGAGGTVDFPFTAPGNAVGSFVVKKGKKSAAIPGFVDLVGPDDESIFVDAVDNKSGFKAKDIPLNRPGTYVLTVSAETAGDVAVKGKWKVSKPVKRTVDASQIVVLPILAGITPDGGENSGAINVSIDAAFAQPGATVRFIKIPTVVAVSSAAIAVDEDGLTFVLNLIPFTAGQYDLELENPDGGTDLLEDVFEVVNAEALPDTLTPAFGFDDAVVRVSVQGAFLSSGATLELRKDSEVIVGAGVSGGGSSMSADFDLRGRTLGLWDLYVLNPSAAEGSLPGAFTILNAPPTLDSVTPDRNLGNPVVNSVLTGTEIEDGATVRLALDGETDVDGTAISFVSDGEIRATFDTVGIAVGRWDVVLRNPDGQEATLERGFRTNGPVGDAAKVIGAIGEAHGPIGVVYNPDRDEFAVTWVDIDTAGTSYIVYLQRVDSDGTALGSAVSVSASASGTEKRDATVAYNSEDGQYLVAWAERKSVTLSGSSHPYGNSGTTMNLFSVFAQRFTTSNLVKQSTQIQITDSVAFPSSWPINTFHNYRPTVVWDPVNDLWQIAWMQEWSTLGLNAYSKDDYDVFQRSLNPADDKVGDASGTADLVTNIASSPTHEGDPHLAWDPVNETTLIVFNQRAAVDTDPLDIMLGSQGGSRIVQASGADLVDPRIAIDPDSERILVTWTRLPASGARDVEAILADLANPATVIGNVRVLGTGSGDHLQAWPAYNADEKEGMVAWSRKDANAAWTVRTRRVDTSATSGLGTVGPEVQTGGEDDDAAVPVAITATAAGEVAVFWLQTISQVRPFTYVAIVTPVGDVRGRDIWLQRIK